MQRRQFVLAAVGAAVLLAGLTVPVALAHHGPPYPSGPDHDHGEMIFYPMVFPVQGTNSFTDTFFASRCCDAGEIHHATDIMSPKMTPIVSPVDGVIDSVNWSHSPGNIDYSRCCTISIEHDDDWESRYIHLNNDTPGTDDGRGALGPIVDGLPNPAWGVAPGIVPGARVTAGQLIGWVGDSGNAEGTSPHLHFELIDPYGVWLDAYQALRDARAGLYQPCEPDDLVCRIAGPDRYATAAQVSQANFPDGAGIVFIATGLGFPDALAGGPVAAHVGAPLLLVSPTAVPSSTAAELTRLDPDQIVVLGGEGVVSAAVFNELDFYGSVIRLAGANRYATAAAISQFGFPDGTTTVSVANGHGFADALAGGPAAAYLEGAVLLTQPGSLPPETLAELTRLGPDAIILVGGTGAVSEAVEAELAAIAPTTRIAGADRYATAAALSAAVFPPGVSNLHLAVGTAFPDALTGGAAAGLSGSPLLIVATNSLPAVIADEIARLQPDHATVLGGTSAVAQSVMNAVTALID